VFSNTKRGKFNYKERAKRALLLQAKANAARLRLKLKLLKEKRYSYKQEKITITKELKQLENKARMLKDFPLLELITRTANPFILDTRLFTNLG